MKILKFVFILFLLLGIISCKKTENTSAKITVVDKTAQRGVPNLKVVLTEIHNTALLGRSADNTFTLLKTGYTDANGKFDFGEFVTQKKGRYTYSVAANSTNPNGSSNLGKGISNDVLLEKVYSIPVTINFLPPPPYSTGDSLSFNIISAAYPTLKHKITNNSYLSGHSLGTSTGYHYINIDKYKSGVYTNVRDTVFFLYEPNSIYEYDVNW